MKSTRDPACQLCRTLNPLGQAGSCDLVQTFVAAVGRFPRITRGRAGVSSVVVPHPLRALAAKPLNARGQAVSLGLDEDGKAVVQAAPQHEEAATSATLDSDPVLGRLQSVKVAGAVRDGQVPSPMLTMGHCQNPDVSHHPSSAKRS